MTKKDWQDMENDLIERVKAESERLEYWNRFKSDKTNTINRVSLLLNEVAEALSRQQDIEEGTEKRPTIAMVRELHEATGAAMIAFGDLQAAAAIASSAIVRLGNAAMCIELGKIKEADKAKSDAGE